MTEELTRRAYLSLNLSAAVGFLGNLIAPQLQMERNFFRPPGALDELEFLTSCTRCNSCVEACPEKSISLFTSSNGTKLMNTPFLEPNLSPCTYCGKCRDVCPTEALSKIGLKFNYAIGHARINNNSCIALKGVICDYCEQSCPIEGALVFQKGKPVISENLCNGCGICVAHCISEDKGIFITLP